MLKLYRTYTSPNTKLNTIKGIKNITTFAPIIITGSPEQIAFTWLVEFENSTGAGFRAIK